MKNLFNQTDSAAIIERIEKLQPDARPLWGKMNVPQMLTHCRVTFQVYFDELKLKRGLVGILFGGFAKKKMLHDGEFSKNLPTAKEFLVADMREFETEKQNLVNIIKRFTSSPDAHAIKQHPFFGKMNGNEWAVLAYKHMDHHLRQFGV
jgi:hypothetical protein